MIRAMPAEAASSIREDERKELHKEQRRRIQNTIRANEKRMLDEFVAGKCEWL